LPRALWRLRLAKPAEQDFQSILAWTLENFGRRQAVIYRATLRSAIESLRAGPGAPGVRKRAELGEAIFVLHVSRNRRPGRHFIVFRHAQPDVIVILRILHDAMDMTRHRLPDDP
jgi:toxin ParE1/3/4